jgi:hypothetical protein
LRRALAGAVAKAAAAVAGREAAEERATQAVAARREAEAARRAAELAAAAAAAAADAERATRAEAEGESEALRADAERRARVFNNAVRMGGLTYRKPCVCSGMWFLELWKLGACVFLCGVWKWDVRHKDARPGLRTLCWTKVVSLLGCNCQGAGYGQLPNHSHNRPGIEWH